MKNVKKMTWCTLLLIGTSMLAQQPPQPIKQAANTSEQFISSVYADMRTQFASILDKLEWADLHFHAHSVGIQADGLEESIAFKTKSLQESKKASDKVKKLKEFEKEFPKLYSVIHSNLIKDPKTQTFEFNPTAKKTFNQCMEKYGYQCVQFLITDNQESEYIPGIGAVSPLAKEIFEEEAYARKSATSGHSADSSIAFYQAIQPMRSWIDNKLNEYLEKFKEKSALLTQMKEHVQNTLNTMKRIYSDKDWNRWTTDTSDRGRATAILAYEIIKDSINRLIPTLETKPVKQKTN